MSGRRLLTLVQGKNGETGGSFPQPVVFICGGEREVRGGPLELVSDAGAERGRRANGTRQVPLPGVTDRWAAVGILMVARVRFAIGLHCS
jgi:hypothetical protein